MQPRPGDSPLWEAGTNHARSFLLQANPKRAGQDLTNVYHLRRAGQPHPERRRSVAPPLLQCSQRRRPRATKVVIRPVSACHSVERLPGFLKSGGAATTGSIRGAPAHLYCGVENAAEISNTGVAVCAAARDLPAACMTGLLVFRTHFRSEVRPALAHQRAGVLLPALPRPGLVERGHAAQN